ncbi:CRISPR-associated protein, Cmr4 family [Stigmatella aurantiaca]|uniref:CRISPR-associated protein, Cmr4 family n=2 Tax=Stigmatella aurantiaca TaxID=41 RepID=A0A1H7L9D9_STIAU|nr:CRISPR-associated protein, Cmr4 family [Stigmatella aurantiaca]
MTMEIRPYLLHALSPLHAGTGQSVGIIDLPIARLRATNIPFVPGSSLKGVLREARRALPSGEWEALFGPLRSVTGPAGDVAQEGDHAGALVVGDARLVALPVRSFTGTFALVSSPLLLELARRDLAGLPGVPAPLKRRAGPGVWVGVDSVVAPKGSRQVFLEDLDLSVHEEPGVEAWGRFLGSALPGEEELVRERFVVVDDETMNFLMETATQVDTRVRIDAKTGAVEKGALWQEESLPAETLLIGVLAAGASLRKGTELRADEVLERALRGTSWLQLGGKATVGRGRCRLAAWPAPVKESRR